MSFTFTRKIYFSEKMYKSVRGLPGKFWVSHMPTRKSRGGWAQGSLRQSLIRRISISAKKIGLLGCHCKQRSVCSSTILLGMMIQICETSLVSHTNMWNPKFSRQTPTVENKWWRLWKKDRANDGDSERKPEQMMEIVKERRSKWWR